MNEIDDIKLNILAMKVSCYASIGWGLLVLFALTGFIMKNPAATMMLVVIAASWVLIRIVQTAFTSFNILKLLNQAKNDPKNQDLK